MKYIYVCSTNQDYVESFRSTLVYTDARGLMFRFYSEMEAVIVDVNRLGMPGAILIDQHMEAVKIPAALKSKCIRLAQAREASERSIYIYQSTQCFIDELLSILATTEPQVNNKVAQCVLWILDLEEGKQGARFTEALANQLYRRGSTVSLLDLSKWGDLSLEQASGGKLTMSLLMHEYHSSGDLKGLKDSTYKKLNFIGGSTHPLDLHQMSRGFLSEVFSNSAGHYENCLTYSGLNTGEVFQFLLESSSHVLILDSSGLDENRKNKITKVKQWLEGNNPLIKIRLETLDGVSSFREETLRTVLDWLA